MMLAYCTTVSIQPRSFPPPNICAAGNSLHPRVTATRAESSGGIWLLLLCQDLPPLTVMMLVGKPGMFAVLVGVVGVALGALLGTEILEGPRALLGIAHLVLVGGSRALAPSIRWAGK